MRSALGSRLVGALLVAVGVGVVLFGLGIPYWVEYRREVVNWSTAWAIFDLLLGVLVLLTWWGARRESLWSFATAGAVNAMQATDVLFSLLVFYDVSERPFILMWAFVFQPVFGCLLWWYVLRHVRAGRPGAPTEVP